MRFELTSTPLLPTASEAAQVQGHGVGLGDRSNPLLSSPGLARKSHLEVPPGVEPGWMGLQSITSPLGQGTKEPRQGPQFASD